MWSLSRVARVRTQKPEGHGTHGRRRTARLVVLTLALLLGARTSGAMQRLGQEAAYSGSAGVPATDVRLPALFTGHMVMQRGRPLHVWGWANPGGDVRVTVDVHAATAEADAAGRWAVELPPMEAGGPYELTVAGTDTLVLRDVLIGEVWVASGQSNMAWPVAEAAHAEAELAAADHPEIRLFTVEHDLSDTPKADVTSGGWRVCSPETVADFSAVAYFFGRALHDSLGVPVGLIHSSWGGTPAEAWTGRAALAAHPDFQERMDTLRTGVFFFYRHAAPSAGRV